MIGASPALRGRVWVGLILAVASCLFAVLVRRLLGEIFPSGFPFVVFFPAVIVTSYFGGRLPGMVCAILCTLAVWYLFTPPLNGFGLDPGTALALLLFTFVSSFIALLIGHMQTVTSRLAAEQRKSAQLYERERVLFQELQHRVANNMQFVSSLLHLQLGQLPAEASSAAAALEDASRRIQVMARVHRRLYDASATEIPLADYFAEILNEVIDASGITGIECRFDVLPVRFDIQRLTLLSLITVEVVTNCLKHAFGERAGGMISVGLHRLGSSELELTIADDGCGMPAGNGLGEPDRHKPGLGTRILKALAAQLRGKISLTSAAGTITRLRFPLGDARVVGE